MIDFKNLERYRENNRIEAKKALGGFPQSVWETYSAFANTLGGIILLGVEEHRDLSLHAVDLPDPEKLVNEFWATVNNPEKVSANILSNKHVSVEVVDGKHIIVITVPRARRADKPIYIGGNALLGSYRRSGEGDYRCSHEEIEAMLRDAAVKTPDMRVLEDFETDAIDYDSVHRYRARIKNLRHVRVFQELEDDEFLYKLGALGRSGNDKFHPTAAGLLMFGKAREIVKEYPRYLLKYVEEADGRTEELSSLSGDWSGNIHDFYFRVYEKIVRSIGALKSAESQSADDTAAVNNALREALANCLINADYFGRGGVLVIKKRDLITFSNPGGFRIDVEVAKAGGISDPRNDALIRMFNLVDIGERTGSGIPNIFSVWERQGWATPSISESFDPERITLSLPLCADDTQTSYDGAYSEKNAAKSNAKSLAQKAAIVDYLTDHASGTIPKLCKLLGLDSARIERLLCDLIASDIVVAESSESGKIYKLKR